MKIEKQLGLGGKMCGGSFTNDFYNLATGPVDETFVSPIEAAKNTGIAGGISVKNTEANKPVFTLNTKRIKTLVGIAIGITILGIILK